jgi:hypothetical protein
MINDESTFLPTSAVGPQGHMQNNPICNEHLSIDLTSRWWDINGLREQLRAHCAARTYRTLSYGAAMSWSTPELAA